MELIGSNKLERLWKEAVLSNLGHYSSSCLEGLKKITKTSIIMASVLIEIRNGTKDIRSRQTQVRGSDACTSLLSRYVRKQAWFTVTSAIFFFLILYFQLDILLFCLRTISAILSLSFLRACCYIHFSLPTHALIN